MVGNIGVVEAPKNYPKTPITDSLNRRAQAVPRGAMPANSGEKIALPKPESKKTIFTNGNISAACITGSFLTAGTLLISRLIKLIKHK